MEWTLQQQGFDLCYDKRLYDRLAHEPRRIGARAPAGRRGLPGAADPVHREPRRAARGGDLRARAGAGGRRRDVDAAGRAALPRRPARRAADADPGVPRPRAGRARRPELRAFYERLLRAVADSGLRDGDWRLCDVHRLARQRLAPQPRRLVLGDRATRAHLVVVNLSDAPAQARVHLPWGDLAGRTGR